MKEQVMRTMFFSKYFPLVLLSVGLALPGVSSAGTYTNAFNTDPVTDPDLIIRAPAGWRSTGSHDGSGYISITDAANSLQGTIVLPDIDFAAGGLVRDRKSTRLNSSHGY